MTITSLMFGSIGTIAETSDIQRRAYNQALKEAGLDWVWDKDTYADLLGQSGGIDRLSVLSAATGGQLTETQITSIHARKTDLACAEIVKNGVVLRPGVLELLTWAKDEGVKTAFVTTTYQQNIDAIFEGSNGKLSAADFDYICSRDAVKHGKPAPDAYDVTFQALGVKPEDTVAIEDTAVSIMSAKRAGATVIATPGAFTAGQDFWQADLVVDNLADEIGMLNAHVLAVLGESPVYKDIAKAQA